MMQTIRMLQRMLYPSTEPERGATMVEYGLLITLIGVIVAAGAALLGTDLLALYNSVTASF
jgi:Flp pilus assembly pilin Flp